MEICRIESDAECVFALYQKINALEKIIGINLTIHDVRGVASRQTQQFLMPQRHLHQCAYCNEGRWSISSWDAACVHDCMTLLHSRIRTDAQPFLKCCWKGVWELIVPIGENGHTMLILYAGPFRNPTQNIPETKTRLPHKITSLYQKLPPITDIKNKNLIPVLQLAGQAILNELQEYSQKNEDYGDRKNIIQRFIIDNAHRDITIDDLAEKLHLSHSRTIHVVNQELGISFSKAVINERMLRADNLLKTYPHMTLTEIAGYIGFSDANYFTKCFSNFYGMGPRAWQKTATADTTIA